MADVNLDVDFGVVYLVDKGSFVKIVADRYSAEQTYAVGDYVIHTEQLYKCIMAIDTPEEFDAEKWTQVKLADEVENKANANSVYLKSETYSQTEANNKFATKTELNTKADAEATTQALAGKAKIEHGIYTVKSTNTTSNTLGYWTGNIDVPELYDGLTIRYLTTRRTNLDAVGAEDSVLLNLTLSDGTDTDYIEVIFDRSTYVMDEYQVDEIITMTYFEPASSPTGDYAWVVQRPTVSQQYTTENRNLPVLMSEVPSDISKQNNCGTKRNNGFTFNPSTGDLSVTKLNGRTVDTIVTSASNNLITSGAVFTAIDNLPEPMVFKGTLGADGTITTLPSASESNTGFTYKVITEGIYQEIVCKVGDVVTSNGSEWVLIPSGDTDSDTWRNIKVNGTEKLGNAISSGGVDFVDSTNVKFGFDANGNKINVTLDGIPTSTEMSTALANKMDKTDPSGTGSFSLNRRANTTVGIYSHAEGYDGGATMPCAHAEGYGTMASSTATHAEGYGATASGLSAHAEGNYTSASGDHSHAEGDATNAIGSDSHTEGRSTRATGDAAHAEGCGTNATHKSQHVFGEYNEADGSSAQVSSRGNYVEIVGNGIDGSNRSNARTLDWSGNETLAGNLTFNGSTSLTGEISRLDGRINSLPEPMVLKGTLGVNGTIQSLPTATAENEGYTYKVITDGTYAGQTAKEGDMFSCYNPEGTSEYAWLYIPSGDDINDTWRAIKVNGVERLDNGISSGNVDIVDTTNVKAHFDADGNKISFDLDGIDTSAQVDAKVAALIDDTQASASKVYSSNKVDNLITAFLKNEVGKNLYTGLNEVHGYLNANGTIHSSTQDWETTDFIKVEGMDYITCSAFVVSDNKRAKINMYFMCTYNANKEIIGQDSSNPKTYTVQSGVSYIRFSYRSSIYTNFQVENNNEMTGYEPFIIYNLLKNTLAVDWSDKLWCCVGDSLTEVNKRTDKHYYDYISEKTDIKIYNMGVGGTGYLRGQDSNNAFYQRISNVPTNADVITIFGSLNDIGSGAVLGTKDDTGTSTIGGCINTTLDNLFTAYPLANVGIVTPTPWEAAQYNPLSEPNNASNYVDLLIAICKQRSIPCLDLFHCSLLRPWSSDFRQLAYSKDEGAGVHPNEIGHKLIAPRFMGFLDSLLLH